MNIIDFYQNVPTLETERLVLRKLRKDDAGDYFAFASDPRVTEFLRWGPHGSLEDTHAYLDGVLEEYRQGTNGTYGIELRQGQKLIGSIHLMDIQAYHLKADVGVVLHSGFWGKGIASEALRRVMAFCFQDLGLQRIQGMAVTGNSRACRMMERCGMQREGQLRHYALQKGAWRDFDLYSILVSEFHSS